MKNTETVTYKGKNYKVRTIEVRDSIDLEDGKGLVTLGHKLRIASESLNKAYSDNVNVHGTEEQKLDASIDHYVTNEVLNTLPSVITSRDMVEILGGIEIEENEEIGMVLVEAEW